MNTQLISKNDDIIANLIKAIENFSISIFERDDNKSFTILMEMIDKLDSIISGESVFRLENKTNLYINELAAKFPYLLDGFENGDNLLISDILTYEIKPILKKLI